MDYSKQHKNLRFKNITQKNLEYDFKITLIYILGNNNLPNTLWEKVDSYVIIIIFIKHYILEYKAMMNMKCVIELTLYCFHECWFLSLYHVISPGADQKGPTEKDLVFLGVP